ncbi:hypothetical protein V6C21_00135 [[Clostridium] cellulosi]
MKRKISSLLVAVAFGVMFMLSVAAASGYTGSCKCIGNHQSA